MSFKFRAFDKQTGQMILDGSLRAANKAAAQKAAARMVENMVYAEPGSFTVVVEAY